MVCAAEILEKTVDFGKTYYHCFHLNIEMLKLLVILFITFLLRIRPNFYGNSSRNKKFTRFDSKIAFFKEIPLLLLTSQYKALFFILINQNQYCASKQSKGQKTAVKACFRHSCKAHYLQ